MPSIQNGSWSCDRCGMGGFQEYFEAQSHEFDCDSTSAGKRRRPESFHHSSDIRSPMDYSRAPLSAEAQHQQIQDSAEIDNSPLSVERTRFEGEAMMALPSLLLLPSATPPSNLSQLDIITCQNVELFQATTEDVADFASNALPGGISGTHGQIGIRCVLCKRSPFRKADFHTVFPAAVGSMAACLRTMTDRHFEKCTMLTSEVRFQIEQAKNTTKRKQQKRHDGEYGEEDEWNRISLVDFCLDFCKRMNIFNRSPAQTGLTLEVSHSRNEETSPDVSTIEAFVESGNPLMHPTPLAPKSRRRQEYLQEITQTPSKITQIHRFQMQGSMSEKVSSATLQTSTGSDPPHGDNQLSFSKQKMSHQPQIHLQQKPPSAKGEIDSGASVLPAPPFVPHDGPGINFPYFQDMYGNWICRFCASVPFHFRAPGSVWQSPHPPSPLYIDQHLNQCQAGYSGQGTGQQTSGLQSYGHPPGHQPIGHSEPQWLGPHVASPQYHGQTLQGSSNPQLSSRGKNHGSPPHSQYLSRSFQIEGQYSNMPPMMQPHSAYNPYVNYSQAIMYHTAGRLNPSLRQDGTPMPMHDPAFVNSIEHVPKGTDTAMKAALEHLENAEKEMLDSNKDLNLELVLSEDKSLLTDYFFHVMKQLQICRFSESDRKTRGGKRENIVIGYGGLQCVHCAERPNSRKFFWSNVDRLANSFAEIPSHVLKCRRCPNRTKQALQELKVKHPEQMTQLPRGSQKVFFRRMWRRLHDQNPETDRAVGQLSPQRDSYAETHISSPSESKKLGSSSSQIHRVHTPEAKRRKLEESSSYSSPGSFVVGMTTGNAAKALAKSVLSSPSSSLTRVMLAIDEDKEWLSDMDCFVRENLEVFCASSDDVQTAQSDRKFPVSIGQVGIRCVHCVTKAAENGVRGTAVSFPYSINGIYESVREFQRLHLESCPNLSEDFRSKLSSLKGSSSLSSVLRRYYILAAKALGMYDTNDGIRAGGDSKPIGASATYEFTSSSGTSSSNFDSAQKSAALPSISSGRDSPSLTPLEKRERKLPEGDSSDKKTDKT